MNIMNYTPHSVTLLSESGTEFDSKTKCYRVTNEEHGAIPIEKMIFMSCGVARCSVKELNIDTLEIKDFFEDKDNDCYDEIITTIPLIGMTFGDIEGLPEPREGTYYIVSAIVANAARAKGRTDVLVPSRMVRDKDGNILGCLAFAIK